MANQNPHTGDGAAALPTRKYTIKFIDEQQAEHVVEVDPEKIPYGSHGEPGSLLDIALGHGVELDHACGGVCACATCHVVVREGFESCNESSDEEEDQLDEAYGLTSASRLACRCVPNGAQPLVVEIPAWNRNLARE